jgi:hypothetical protein
MAEHEEARPAGGAQDSDIAELRRAWINEKASPEILQCAPLAARAFEKLRRAHEWCARCRFKTELVQRLTEQAQHQARDA